MKAIVLREPKRFGLEEVENPVPSAEEVEIKVQMAGICGTDLHLLRGKIPFATYPLIPGHEYIGEVLQAPAGANLNRGDRVTVYPGIGCGKCMACRMGRLPHCPEFQFTGVSMSGGCFAERTVAHSSRVFLLPAELDDQMGALIEPTAVGIHAVRRAGLCSESARNAGVVVIGGGTIGLLIAQVALTMGVSRLILSEPVAERRELARAMGIEMICDPVKEDLLTFVRREIEVADVVFDVVGSDNTLLDSEKILCPGGNLVLVAVPSRQGMGIPYELIFRKELQAIGTRTYFIEDFTAAISILAAQKIDVKPLISVVLPLKDFSKGIRLLETEPHKYIKILIDPSTSS